MATYKNKGIKEAVKKLLRPLVSYIPNYYRYGKIYKYKVKELSTVKNKNIEKEQLEKIKRIVKHAYDTVPYYKNLLDKNNINPEITTFKEFEKIPFLTKDILRENLEEIISSKNIKKIKVTTGGTTGMPMELYVDLDNFTIERAYVDYHWSKVGFKNKGINKIAVLRGTIPEGQQLFQQIGSTLIMSSFKLNDITAPEYLKKIEVFNADFIHIYPSSLHILAKYITQNKIKLRLPKLKYILSSSETLYEFQKKEIKKAFGVDVCDLYGHTEHAVIAFSYFAGDPYHIDPTYGYTELIGKGQNLIDGEGIEGEIVATGFNNWGMPLIRYKTEDRAISGKNRLEFKQILGRKQEYFVGKNKENLVFTCSDEPFWGVEKKIEAYQYVQEKEGVINLNLIKKREFLKEEETQIKKVFKTIYPDLDLNINYVSDIKRTKSGKYRYLIQKLKI